MKEKLGPVWGRAAPFFIFVGLTLGQKLGGNAAYWFYAAKTLVGAGLILLMRPRVPEMRWQFSWAALGIGIIVWAFWVGLDPFYPKPGAAASAWNPLAKFGPHSLVGWTFATVRLLGSTLIVPPLEEVFWRSLVYRYLVRSEFLKAPLNRFYPLPFLITSVLFGLNHREWLAGILCGLLYQGLVVWKGRLGDAMTAHALTNFLLGVWVVSQRQWQFW